MKCGLKVFFGESRKVLLWQGYSNLGRSGMELNSAGKWISQNRFEYHCSNEVTCDPYPEFVICIQPIQVHTHTHTHSSSGPPMLRRLGSGWGSVPCSRVSPQLWYWRWREHSLFTPPHWLFLPDPRFEPTTSGYNALSIRISDMENGWMDINIL